MLEELGFILDPTYLFETCIGSPCDNWQKKILTDKSKRKQWLVVSGRQQGKSTLGSIICLHVMLAKPGSTSIAVSRSHQQAKELLRRIEQAYYALPEKARPERTDDSKYKIELANNSRVISIPTNEDTARGWSVDGVLLLDEAARCDRSILSALEPSLAVGGGDVYLLTTPNGQNWFYDLWEAKDTSWKRMSIKAKDNPRIDPRWLADKKATMPNYEYASEFECSFVEVENQVFGSRLVRDAFSDDVEALFA